MGRSRALIAARRIVVKVGSGLITAPGEGPVAPRISALAADLAALVKDGREVALVSSGAIATGMARLGLPARPRSIPEKQAAAAVGQSALMWQYEQAFKRHGIQVGQVLLTREDIGDARATSTRAIRFSRCSTSASCPSSMRTTRWPWTRSRSATTTISPPSWRI